MKRVSIGFVLLLALPVSVAACLWDRDTPADEAKGMPEVVAVLTGRFKREPALFYEMRLTRVAVRLRDFPDDLAAYDDAGVACDRLGRGDEAIAWMEKKRAKLDRLDPATPEAKEQRYRYHANLGTFLVHRWARRGADRSKLDEVKAARDEIAAALEINPNAHFGREKYQLMAIQWILNPPRANEGETLPNLLGWSFEDIYGEGTDPKEADEAVRGLAGLVALGNAWESVDVFHALNIALQRDSVGYKRGREGGRNTLAYFAWLRCRELIDAGGGSMLPDAPKGEALKAKLRPPDFVKPVEMLDAAYAKLRAEADAWSANRLAFMTPRLKQGRHPDTDPSFWHGYVEPAAPSLPTRTVPEAFKEWMDRRSMTAVLTLVGGFALFTGLLVAALAFVNRRERRRLVD